jgi:hypothetical protein
VRLQRVLFHDHIAPDTLQQLVLGDETSVALDQRDQQVEGVRTEVHGCTGREQAALIGLELEAPKSIADRRCCSGPPEGRGVVCHKSTPCACPPL